MADALFAVGFLCALAGTLIHINRPQPIAADEQQENTLANWFYVVGSLCFLAGTLINMAR